MNIPPIAVVGDSGSGKSSSIRTLPPTLTRILNIEQKILPFREANKFTKSVLIENSNKFDNEFDAALKNDKDEIIVHESFTRYSDKLLELSKSINKGYDIYNFYADKMTAYLNKIIRAENKLNIVLCIPELVELMHPNGVKTNSRRIGINGQKLENKIESYFTIVLFTEVKINPQTKQASYHFVTNSDGTNSAKSPAGMLDQLIPNDLEFVRRKVFDYYSIPYDKQTGEQTKVMGI